MQPAWLAVGLAALVVALLAGFAVARAQHGSAGLAGGVFSDAPAAADFSLIDHNGRQVTMAENRGKVVALTFLYTRCPDVCPTIASSLAVARQRLGTDGSGLQMLAVSVDPVNDTLPAVKKFSQDRGLADAPNWHYLIGSPAQLRSVWRAYHVDSGAEAGGTAAIDHSALVYVVDRQGKMRVVLPANFSVADLVQDVRVLERE